MENKLQELTKKLYDEGLSKGRRQAETLLSEAEAKAAEIVADARAEAARIKGDAEAEAEDLRRNTLAELNLAGRQVVSRLKESIRDMVVAKATEAPVGDTAMDQTFIREMLIAVAKNWQGTSQEHVSLQAMLPEAMRGKLDKAFEQSVRGELEGGLNIEFSEKIKNGFRIGPHAGGYHISFTDEGFDELLGEYLRPRVDRILYGDEKQG